MSIFTWEHSVCDKFTNLIFFSQLKDENATYHQWKHAQSDYQKAKAIVIEKGLKGWIKNDPKWEQFGIDHR